MKKTKAVTASDILTAYRGESWASDKTNEVVASLNKELKALNQEAKSNNEPEWQETVMIELDEEVYRSFCDNTGNTSGVTT